MFSLITFAIFGCFFIIYYLFPFAEIEGYKTFLSLATFLFAVFAGFFISRQGQRYSLIRDLITKSDGSLSYIYRLFGHLGKNSQKAVTKIIKDHCQKILKNNAWDWHFVHKSTTMT